MYRKAVKQNSLGTVYYSRCIDTLFAEVPFEKLITGIKFESQIQVLYRTITKYSLDK